MTAGEQELLSVVIPVYMNLETLGESLRSLLHQTYKNIEFIIVHLESGDEIRRVLGGIHDPRLRVVEQKMRNGPGGARNLGVEQARGSWIGFVEADDIIEENFYGKLIEHTGEDVDIVWGGISLNGERWVDHPVVSHLSSFEEKMARVKNGATFDKIFRTDLIRKHNIRFTEDIRWEDNLFLFRALYHARGIVAVPGIYYTYRPTPWSKERRASLQRDVIPAATEIVLWAKGLSISERQRGLIYRKIIENFALSFLTDADIYRQMEQLMGKHWFLTKNFLKQKWKKFKRQIFNKNTN